MNNRVVDNKGYQKDNVNKDSPYKIIQGGDITMKKVDKQVLAIKLDENGLPIGMKFMKPNKEYKFDDANSVLEIPKYQSGKVPFDLASLFAWNQNGQQPAMAPQQPQYGTEGAMLSVDANGNPVSVPSQPYPLTKSQTESMIAAEQKLNPQITIPQQNNVPTVTLPDQSAPNVEQGASLNMPREQVSTTRDKGLVELAKNNSKVEQQKVYAPTADIPNLISTVKDEGLNMRERPEIQFFNPYGGMDIPTAASTLGSSIESGNTLGIIGSGLKLATGLGRNIVGGIANQRQNDFAMEEYYKKLGNSLENRQYLQKGGEVRAEDLDMVNNATGVDFDLETAQRLFQMEMPQNNQGAKVKEDIDYGWYDGAGYFNVDKEVGDKIFLNNTANNPHNAHTLKDVQRYLQKKNPNREIIIDYIPNLHMQKGGQVKKQQLLTGEYITGVNQNDERQMQKVNGETESGEYLQTPEGDIAEIIGNKHSEGGEKMPLEDGDRVLTDHLKLGAKNAKYIRDNFDIEVKAKNTYSSVLDKFRTKIGLNKLVKEEEELLKKLEETSNMEDSDTKGLNEMFLNNKIKEIRKQKEPIEEARKMLYDKLFDMQESGKPKEKGNQDNKYQDGVYIKRNEGLDYVPEGQSNNGVFYGGVTQEDFFNLMRNNPWYDWSNFDPNKKEDVLDFQRKANAMVNNKVVKEDGLLGEQTASISIPRTVGASGVEPTSINMDMKVGQPLPMYTPNKEISANLDIESEGVDNRKALNVIGLPDQYPMMPSGIEPHLKSERRFDRVSPMKIDPTPYLNQVKEQVGAAKAQLEGLSPNVRAAAEANIDANAQKAISDVMMKIDTSNIAQYNQADNTNAQIQRMQENAGVMDDLSFEQRQLRAKAIHGQDMANYFDKIDAVNIGNYQTINALNNMNARYSDIQFDGNGYVVSPNPIDGKMLDQRIKEKMKQMEEQNKSKKSTV